MENTINDQMTSSLDKDIDFKFLIKFSLPSIIMMVFLSVYTIVDGVFISKLVGTDALSAVNIVYPVIALLMAISTMIGTGGNAIVSRKLGEGKTEEARKDFSTLVYTVIFLGVTLSILSYLFLKPIIIFLGANAAIYEYCDIYAKIMLIFTPALLLAMMFKILLVTAGQGHLGLILTVLGGVVNMILDYVFISTFNMGIAGAALATGIGYCITGLCGLVYFIFARKNVLHLVKPHFHADLLKETCINGSSEMVSTLSGSIITLVFNNILMRMAGVDGVAAITVILYLQMLLAAVYMGYAMGISPLLGYNYGKKDEMNLKSIFKISIITISIISGAVLMFGVFKAGSLAALFTHRGTNVYILAESGLRLFSVSFLFSGINIFASSMFTALSNGKVSAIISFVRTLAFQLICLYTLPTFLGINGVWLAIPVAELLSLVVSIYFIRKYRNEYKYY